MTLKVIGAGLGRTGTTSLKMALAQLGLGPCYYMSEILSTPQAIPLWLDAVAGQPDWERIFAGYQSTMDYPGCTLWREISDHYPDAKIILTVRDPDRWFESVNETIFSDAWVATTRASPAAPFFDKLVYADFGDRIADRGFMIDYFHHWNEAIVMSVPVDRLLIYEAVEGWEPLCEFLDVDVPSTLFPHANTRQEMLEMLEMAQGFAERTRH